MEKSFEAIMHAMKLGLDVRFESMPNSGKFMVRVLNIEKNLQAGGYITFELMGNIMPETKDQAIESNIKKAIKMVS